jgi:MauM/NapG family ferredoxin protein
VKDPKDPKSVSRRGLLTFWKKPLEELRQKPAPAAPPPEPAVDSTRWPLRPPGMMQELLLQHYCIRCGKCVEACPAEAIFPLGAAWGKAKGTPAIDARKQPCVLCDGLQCTHVCPSGALIPVYANRDVDMGLAVLDPARCVTHKGEACDVCVATCPIPGAIAVAADGKVTIVDDACVGCGLCEHVCPTEPASVRVTPRA